VPALLRREGAAVEKAVAAYKAALKNAKATKVERATADAAAKKAQKRYLALKEQVKMDEDKKKAALELALEAAQELEHKRNAVALTPQESLEIVKKVGELTKIVATGDADADAALRATALENALEYQDEQKKAMTRYRRAAEAVRDDLGDKSPEYATANAKFYHQKAIFEQVQKLLASQNAAGAAAAAKVDKAKYGGELAGW
jgi:hypothetical protein